MHREFFIAASIALLLFSSCSSLKTYTSVENALQNPNEVERLKISNKNLKVLPKEIAQFKNLKELILFRDHLDSLTAVIGEFTQLKLIAVSSCRLIYIDPAIGKLKNLELL